MVHFHVVWPVLREISNLVKYEIAPNCLLNPRNSVNNLQGVFIH